MTEATATAVEATWTPTRDDYRGLVGNMTGGRSLAVLGWVLLALGVLMALVEAWAATPEGPLDATFLLLIVFALFALAYPRVLARLAWRAPLNREPVTGRVDDVGVSHSGPSGMQMLTWAGATRAAETADAFYVRIGSGVAGMMFWFPKRALAAPEQEQVRALLRAHVRSFRG